MCVSMWVGVEGCRWKERKERMKGKFGSTKCSCYRRARGDEESEKGGKTGGRKSVEQTKCRVCVGKD